MATYDYAALEVRAAALLDRFGATGCRVVRPGAGAADPVAPWKPTGSTPDVVVAMDLTAVGDNIGYRRGKRDAPQALTGSAAGKAYLRGTVPEILPGDWLEVPNSPTTYERMFISRAEPITPGGTTLLWELTLRA